jgi:hypothetical protein
VLAFLASILTKGLGFIALPLFLFAEPLAKLAGKPILASTSMKPYTHS